MSYVLGMPFERKPLTPEQRERKNRSMRESRQRHPVGPILEPIGRIRVSTRSTDYSVPVLRDFLLYICRCDSKGEESKALGITPVRLNGWIERGVIPTYVADAAAVRLGCHPSEIWGGDAWLDGAEQESTDQCAMMQP